MSVLHHCTAACLPVSASASACLTRLQHGKVDLLKAKEAGDGCKLVKQPVLQPLVLGKKVSRAPRRVNVHHASPRCLPNLAAACLPLLRRDARAVVRAAAGSSGSVVASPPPLLLRCYLLAALQLTACKCRWCGCDGSERAKSAQAAMRACWPGHQIQCKQGCCRCHAQMRLLSKARRDSGCVTAEFQRLNWMKLNVASVMNQVDVACSGWLLWSAQAVLYHIVLFSCFAIAPAGNRLLDAVICSASDAFLTPS